MKLKYLSNIYVLIHIIMILLSLIISSTVIDNSGLNSQARIYGATGYTGRDSTSWTRGFIYTYNPGLYNAPIHASAAIYYPLDDTVLVAGEVFLETGAYIMKINPYTGEVYWFHRMLGEGGHVGIYSMAIDKDGNILVGGKISNGNDMDAFVALLDPYGNPIWLTVFGTSGYEEVYSIAYCPELNAVVAGGHYNFDIGDEDSTGRGFIAMIDEDTGDVKWLSEIGDTGSEIQHLYCRGTRLFFSGWYTPSGSWTHNIYGSITLTDTGFTDPIYTSISLRGISSSVDEDSGEFVFINNTMYTATVSHGSLYAYPGVAIVMMDPADLSIKREIVLEPPSSNMHFGSIHIVPLGDNLVVIIRDFLDNLHIVMLDNELNVLSTYRVTGLAAQWDWFWGDAASTPHGILYTADAYWINYAQITLFIGSDLRIGSLYLADGVPRLQVHEGVLLAKAQYARRYAVSTGLQLISPSTFQESLSITDETYAIRYSQFYYMPSDEYIGGHASDPSEVFDHYIDRLPYSSLDGTHHLPSLDIYDYYWYDAGRDAFDNYGYTSVCPAGACTDINIRPPESGGSKAYRIRLSDGAEYIVYKDMATDTSHYPGILRTILLPANRAAMENSIYVLRDGFLGTTSYNYTYQFTWRGMNYTYLMTRDYSGTPGSGIPNTWFFMVSLDGAESTYTHDLSGSYLLETLENARGVTALYIAPTDNVMGDENIAEFLRSELDILNRTRGYLWGITGDGKLYAVKYLEEEPVVETSFVDDHVEVVIHNTMDTPITGYTVRLNLSEYIEAPESFVVLDADGVPLLYCYEYSDHRMGEAPLSTTIWVRIPRIPAQGNLTVKIYPSSIVTRHVEEGALHILGTSGADELYSLVSIGGRNYMGSAVIDGATSIIYVNSTGTDIMYRAYLFGENTVIEKTLPTPDGRQLVLGTLLDNYDADIFYTVIDNGRYVGGYVFELGGTELAGDALYYNSILYILGYTREPGDIYVIALYTDIPISVKRVSLGSIVNNVKAVLMDNTMYIAVETPDKLYIISYDAATGEPVEAVYIKGRYRLVDLFSANGTAYMVYYNMSLSNIYIVDISRNSSTEAITVHIPLLYGGNNISIYPVSASRVLLVATTTLENLGPNRYSYILDIHLDEELYHVYRLRGTIPYDILYDNTTDYLYLAGSTTYHGAFGSSDVSLITIPLEAAEIILPWTNSWRTPVSYIYEGMWSATGEKVFFTNASINIADETLQQAVYTPVIEETTLGYHAIRRPIPQSFPRTDAITTYALSIGSIGTEYWYASASSGDVLYIAYSVLSSESLEPAIYVSAVNASSKRIIWAKRYSLSGAPVRIVNPNNYSLIDYQVRIDLTGILDGIYYLKVAGENGEPLPFCYETSVGECSVQELSKTIWVRIPYIPANGSYTVYISLSETNYAAPPEDVFLFYDDFDNARSDRWIWQGAKTTGYDSYIGDSYLGFAGDYTDRVATHTYTVFPDNTIIEAVLYKRYTDDDHFIYISRNPTAPFRFSSDKGVIRFTWFHDTKYIYGQNTSVAASRPDETYYYIRIAIARGRVEFYDQEYYYPDSNNTLSLNESLNGYYLFIGADTDYSSQYGRWYWIRVRRYSDQEPLTILPDTIPYGHIRPQILRYTDGALILAGTINHTWFAMTISPVNGTASEIAVGRTPMVPIGAASYSGTVYLIGVEHGIPYSRIVFVGINDGVEASWKLIVPYLYTASDARLVGNHIVVAAAAIKDNIIHPLIITIDLSTMNVSANIITNIAGNAEKVVDSGAVAGVSVEGGFDSFIYLPWTSEVYVYRNAFIHDVYAGPDAMYLVATIGSNTYVAETTGDAVEISLHLHGASVIGIFNGQLYLAGAAFGYSKYSSNILLLQIPINATNDTRVIWDDGWSSIAYRRSSLEASLVYNASLTMLNSFVTEFTETVSSYQASARDTLPELYVGRILDTDAPRIDAHLPEDIVFNKTIRIPLNITIYDDETAVKKYSVMYRVSGETEWINITSMVGEELVIGRYYEYVYIRITAEDICGNQASLTKTIEIIDVDPPQVALVIENYTVYSGGVATVHPIVYAFDNESGVRTIELYYSLDNETWGRADYAVNGSLTIDTVAEKLYVKIRVLDKYNAAEALGETILDDPYPPRLSVIVNETANYTCTGTYIPFTARYYDNETYVTGFTVMYSFDNSTWYPADISGGTIYVPSYNRTVYLLFRAIDAFNNTVEEYRTVSIHDACPPNIGYSAPSYIYYNGEPVNLTVNFTINDLGSGIKNIELYYRLGQGQWIQLPYSDTIVIHIDSYADKVYLYVKAIDNDNNVADKYITVTIIDRAPPKAELVLPDKAYYSSGEAAVYVTVLAHDYETGIGSITLYMSNDNSSWIPCSEAINNTLVYNIYEHGYTDTLYFRLIVVDNKGNSVIVYDSVSLVDDTPPAITLDAPSSFNYTGPSTEAVFYVEVSDGETLVESIYAYYSFDNETWIPYGSISEEDTIIVKLSRYHSTIYVKVDAVDAAGNTETMIIYRVINDKYPPRITLAIPAIAYYMDNGTDINITVYIRDETPIKYYTLYYSVDNTTWYENKSFINSTLHLDRYYTRLYIMVYATDSSNNTMVAIHVIDIIDKVKPQATLIIHDIVYRGELPYIVEVRYTARDNETGVRNVVLLYNAGNGWRSAAWAGPGVFHITMYRYYPSIKVLLLVTDKSNNTVAVTGLIHVYDENPPRITVTFIPEYTYTGEPLYIVVSINASDESLVASVRLYYSLDNKTWLGARYTGNKKYVITLSFYAERIYLKAEATDIYGNTRVEYSSIEVLDGNPPIINADISMGYSDGKYTYIYVNCLNIYDGESNLSGIFIRLHSGGTDIPLYMYTPPYLVFAGNYSGGTLFIEAVDENGNVATYSVEVFIDTHAPRASVLQKTISVDKQTTITGYGEINIKIADDYSETAVVEIYLNNKKLYSGIIKLEETPEGYQRMLTVRYSIWELESTNTIEIRVSDKYNHTATYIYSLSLMDEAAPSISVNATGLIMLINGTESIIVVPNIVITEPGSGLGWVDMYIEYYYDETHVARINLYHEVFVEHVTEKSYSLTFTAPLEKPIHNRKLYFIVEVTDNAGNTARYREELPYIDQTPPDIIVNHTLTGDAIEINISAEDPQSGIQGVAVYLSLDYATWIKYSEQKINETSYTGSLRITYSDLEKLFGKTPPTGILYVKIAAVNTDNYGSEKYIDISYTYTLHKEETAGGETGAEQYTELLPLFIALAIIAAGAAIAYYKRQYG